MSHELEGLDLDNLTRGHITYLPVVPGRLEFAMEAVIKADVIEAKMRKAAKEGLLTQRTVEERRAVALAQGIITQVEIDHLEYTDRLRRDVIKVDDFEHELGRGAQSQEEPWPDSKKKVAAASM